MKSFFREVLITAVLALLIFFAVQVTVQTFIVIGSSMQPNFQDGQRLLVNKAVYKFRQPERGEVIVFVPPNRLQVDYIKRIIGVPGDVVEIKRGVVYVNKVQLDEPYIKLPSEYSLNPQTVPPDNYFVLGDNRGNSNDSHNGWVVPHDNVVGKAWLSIWPPTKWGMAANYPLDDQFASPKTAGVNAFLPAAEGALK